MSNSKNDFTQGNIVGNILKLAIPMTLAQLINVLYSIIDRIFIGRIPENATLALTGLGLCLPITSIVMAFANLFGMGGAPLCSIERGRGNEEEAEKIMGNSFVLMLAFGVVLTVLGLIFKKPLLYMFGASDATYPYAAQFAEIYLLGTIFVMVGLGMNSFINSQGFGTIGMMTVLMGAVVNIILDPIFIFTLDMGVRGAAFATVIAQFLSAVWTVRFLTGKKAILKLKYSCFRLDKYRVKSIVGLGMSGFTMAVTNSVVQVMYNVSLQQYGGDLYVGVMTIINSIREVISMPVRGITNSAQPVMGYNYGASEYGRVKRAIVFTSVIPIIYTTAAWGLIHGYPEFFIRIFNHDPEVIQAGVPAMRIYYFGFFFMSLQFAGQSIFVALGKARQAVFFSIFRKVIIVAPLIILLPIFLSNGTSGVFMAEPISNVIGGGACFITMYFTVWRELDRKMKQKQTVTGSL
ncbi:MATE family efflux transporter [Lacrimispora sp.]|jgi:putative MATE family efflux protein|uniref:MATE family efflux transporter n=1 Tax=Lacrimispora sp. TaxID=2719234 RepID=UPI0028ADCA0C|nr:MATE family efflux transporter [Lacrimispora sp.]